MRPLLHTPQAAAHISHLLDDLGRQLHTHGASADHQNALAQLQLLGTSAQH